jgi:Exopolysaccharide biosynthesis protein related to N-acetylglucosamine-1-phosphodiester alpha-N-acetylglucosaminidase
MIESKIETVKYDNGEIQRCQVVKGFDWKDLEFVQAPFSKEPFEELCRMYKVFIIKKHPDYYGALITFHIPEGMESPFPMETGEGLVFDKQLSAAIAIRRLVKDGKIRKQGSKLIIEDEKAKAFFETLSNEGWLSVGYGEKDDEISILPVGEDLGYLGSIEPRPAFCCNTHFFEMDLFDCDSPYDLFGTPYGLIVKDGIVSQPPLNNREALVVDKEGVPKIVRPELKEMTISLQGIDFRHGDNCRIYRRPADRITPAAPGLDVIIVGDEVLAFHEGGEVRIPMGGFVLHTETPLEKIPTPVCYKGFEDCVFGIQVGSSVVKDGELVKEFLSPFYDIHNDSVPFPPTLYPLNYEKDRAPRMAICCDREGKPVIVWAEGCSKLFYQFGAESCGASLLELGRYCHSIGLVNALNLDGGGSSEIFLEGKMSLHVSDRHPDNSDSERPVPMGLMVM